MESKSVEDLINDLENNFGDLVVTIVKKYKLLGININIMEWKKGWNRYERAIFEEIQSFGEDIDEKVTTPASSHLFIVIKKANKVD